MSTDEYRRVTKKLKEDKGFQYLGKYYEWKDQAMYQGQIDCTCKSCQRYLKDLVKHGQLILKNDAQDMEKEQ